MAMAATMATKAGTMASKAERPTLFVVSPYKIAICHLIQVFCSDSQSAVSIPFYTVAQHNRLGLFLFSVTRSCKDFVEPSLGELINQLNDMDHSTVKCYSWLGQNLTEQLGSFVFPDDLFTFFDKLRAVLLPTSGSDYWGDRTILDPHCHLGYFVRCCILSFNALSFEGVCHLLTNLEAYHYSASSAYLSTQGGNAQKYFVPEFLDGSNLDFHHDAENDHNLQSEAVSSSDGSFSFHMLMPKTLCAIVGDMDPYAGHEGSPGHKVDECMSTSNGAFINKDHCGALYLSSNRQIFGYMNEQADLLERHFSLRSSTSLDIILKQLQEMAPEFPRVKYLSYLNCLYRNDYIAALDNLHCYFDCSGGMEGFFYTAQDLIVSTQEGRYQLALLYLGIMHSHFGQFKPALEALTDAVRIAQVKNDDSCLAHTLAAICNLLSEIGTPNATGVIGSPYNSGSSMGLSIPLSTQEQLLVLLKSSIKRAEALNLTYLVAFNRLLLAKFDLKNVRGPLASFGPKAQTMLKTIPISVCKELRLSSFLFSDCGMDGISFSNDSGMFSTSWLKNISHTSRSISKDGGNLNDYDTFSCSSQPNPLPNFVLQLAGASYLLKATSWELYGSAPLARMNALVHLYCFADAASSTELSLAYSKLIQYLMVAKGYKVSFNALMLAEENVMSFPKSHIHLLRLQLLHERALHRGHLKFAQQICDQLGILASSLGGADMELKTEASIRHARTLLAANEFSMAASIAHSLFRMCYEYNLHMERAVVLLLLAEIHKKSGNPVLGLPYALASLSFCQSLNLDLLEASVTLTIAELFLCLGSRHSIRALHLVYRSLPMILGHGGLELRARANIALAKCHLSDPDFSVLSDPDILLDSLGQAAEDLEILEYHEMAAEAFYLMAIVHNMLQQFEEREKAAASFKKHINALEHPVDVELI